MIWIKLIFVILIIPPTIRIKDIMLEVDCCSGKILQDDISYGVTWYISVLSISNPDIQGALITQS